MPDTPEKARKRRQKATRARPTDVKPRKGGRPAGSKNKPKPVGSEDVQLYIKSLVQEQVKSALKDLKKDVGAAVADPIPAEPLKKLTPTPRIPPKQTGIGKVAPAEAREAQIEYLYERTKSMYKIPNPDPTKFYYWINVHPMAQHKWQMDGFRFIVGEDEIRRLGYSDVASVMNGRSRVQIFDMELAWCPKELADKKRAFFTKRAKDRLRETTEDFERTVAQGRKMFQMKSDVKIEEGTQKIIPQGPEFIEAPSNK